MAMNLVIFGSGDQARVVLEALIPAKDINILGLLDDTLPKGTLRYGYPILGKFVDVPPDAHCYHIAVGDPCGKELAVVTASAVNGQARALAVIHPTAILASDAKVLPGAYVGARAIIQPGAEVRSHAILNTGAILEHDCVLGSYSHLAPGVVTGGHVVIGRLVTVGLGAVIRDRVEIGDRAFVGMGSVVTKNVEAGTVVYGNPAREVRENATRQH